MAFVDCPVRQLVKGHHPHSVTDKQWKRVLYVLCRKEFHQNAYANVYRCKLCEFKWGRGHGYVETPTTLDVASVSAAVRLGGVRAGRDWMAAHG